MKNINNTGLGFICVTLITCTTAFATEEFWSTFFIMVAGFVAIYVCTLDPSD